jgi:hypothetical protein
MLMGGEMAAPEVRVEPQVHYTTVDAELTRKPRKEEQRVLIHPWSISYCLQTVHGSTDQLIFELCGSLDLNDIEVVMELCDI